MPKMRDVEMTSHYFFGGFVGERFDKIKKHVEEHKMIYACVGTGVTVAGITWAVMRGKSQHIDRGTSVVANRGISVIADRSVVKNSLSLISSRRQGAPSWVIRCIETNKVFMSQREAANAMGISESELSKHLNGFMDHVRGYHFERIGMAAA